MWLPADGVLIWSVRLAYYAELLWAEGMEDLSILLGVPEKGSFSGANWRGFQDR